jgi:hypothetical protein
MELEVLKYFHSLLFAEFFRLKSRNSSLFCQFQAHKFSIVRNMAFHGPILKIQKFEIGRNISYLM